VPPAELQKRPETKEETKTQNVVEKLRGLAFPDFAGAGAGASRSSALGGGASRPTVASMAQMAESGQQSAARGGAVQMTTQVRMSEQNGLDMVLRPVFQNVPTGGRSSLNLPGIPGGGF